MLYYTILYCAVCAQSSLAQHGMKFACTARYGQIVFTGVAPWSSLAQRGMARMTILVLALGHYLRRKAWPD